MNWALAHLRHKMRVKGYGLVRDRRRWRNERNHWRVRRQMMSLFEAAGFFEAESQ